MRAEREDRRRRMQMQQERSCSNEKIAVKGQAANATGAAAGKMANVELNTPKEGKKEVVNNKRYSEDSSQF